MSEQVRNPFEVMYRQMGSQKLLAFLHPVSYSTIYQYRTGRASGIGGLMHEALSRYFTEEQVDNIEQQYRAWREVRANR